MLFGSIFTGVIVVCLSLFRIILCSKTILILFVGFISTTQSEHYFNKCVFYKDIISTIPIIIIYSFSNCLEFFLQ